MNILFIIPYVPNRVRVRPFNLIRAMAERGHRITLFTVWTDSKEYAELDLIRPYCQEIVAERLPRSRSLLNCLLSIPGQQPFQSVYSWQPSLLAALLNNHPYDVVHVEHLRGTRYGLQFKEDTQIPVVWDSVDCITHLFRQATAHSQDRLRRWRSQLDLNRTEKYEGWLIGRFDHVLVTSMVDKQELRALNRNGHIAPISVVPNGVDLEYFFPDTAVSRDPATLVVSGKMSYHANISMTQHLVDEIMPLVWHRRPDVKLEIVGKDPTREILSLGQHAAVTVTGTVPHLPPYLQRATIAVAPITYGAGIQNKILEAMACATPVITSTAAVKSLPVSPGNDLLVADEPAAFAEAILLLLADHPRREQVGQAGYEYVHANHTWAGAARQLEAIYQQSIASSAAVTAELGYR